MGLEMLMVFSSITWKPHLETGLEIALTARDKGDRVYYVDLTTFVGRSESHNLVHKVVNVPRIRQNNALRILRSKGIITSVEGRDLSIERRARQITKDLLADVKSHDEFLSIDYEDFHDLGWSALSSAVSRRKDSTVSYETHPIYLESWVELSIRVYLKSKELMFRESPSHVIAYNGRFASTRSVIRAAESMGIAWNVYEVGSTIHKYRIHGYLPHDRDRVQDDIKRYVPRKGDLSGDEFFQARRGLSEYNSNDFTRRQKKGVLPEGFNSSCKWVVYFSSSDDEMVAIGGHAHHDLFYDQDFSLKCLREAVAKLPDLRLCVRVHPHISKKSGSDKKKWETLAERYPDVLFVGPGDNVDTYALLDHAYVVASFGSTVGIEATYWGKPSLLLGRSFYDRLDVCEAPESIEGIVDYLQSPKVYDKSNAILYGAYMANFGFKYKYYVAESYGRGSILGRSLDDSLRLKLAQYFKRTLSGLIDRS